jgi:hypothetical protein
MLCKGTTFIWDGHVWFTISEATQANSKVVCVNLTTLDDECPDDECLLSSTDYAWIEKSHPTAVAFSRHRLLRADKIAQVIASGSLKVPAEGNIPAATLSKVIGAARTSRELGDDVRAML